MAKKNTKAEETAALRREIDALRYREKQYLSILDTMSEAVERDDAEFGITYVNNAFCDFYGFSREEVLYTDAMSYVLPEDRPKIYKKMEQLTPENPYYRYTCRVINGAGETVWIEVLGYAFFDSKGNIREYQDISRDISSYKSAEKASEWYRAEMEEKVRERMLELSDANRRLSTVNSYLQSTLNNISEGVILISENGETLFLNYGSNAALSPGENSLSAAIREHALKKKNSAIYRMLRQKEDFKNAEITFATGSGDVAYLVSGSHIEGDGEPGRGLLILKPMAEMKHLINKFSGAQAKYHFEEIIGDSAMIRDAIQLARRVAAGEGNIMIEGESGTGKELFAQSIHNASNRRNGPFIAVNCGALPRDLIASELFGYAEGSFTGAKKGGKPGKFEMATGGTIFLDEIGDMPMEQQITLLRVIQERTVTRIGAAKSIPIDARVICATNKDLHKEVEMANFRQDLFFRLNVINLHIPPLRERREDIPVLFHHFLHNHRSYDEGETVADEAFMNRLLAYDWPGNVRELQNITERAFFIAHGRPFTVQDLPKYLLNAVTAEPNGETVPPETAERTATPKNPEKEQIEKLLAKHRFNASRVAEELGVSRTTLYRKFKKYGLR